MSLTVFPLNRWFTITPGVQGLIGEVGNVNDEHASGAVTIQFIFNDPSYQGQGFVVMSAIAGSQAMEYAKANPGLSVPYVQGVYRAIYLNNAVSDGTLRADPITGNSLIVIPAPATQVGIMVSCTAGTALIVPNRGTGSMIF